MADRPTKMLTPERIALLLLAIVLLVWALVLFIGKDGCPAPVPVEERQPEASDSMQTVVIPVQAKTKPAKTKTAGKSRKKNTKPPVHKRDHLNEPVQ